MATVFRQPLSRTVCGTTHILRHIFKEPDFVSRLFLLKISEKTFSRGVSRRSYYGGGVKHETLFKVAFCRDFGGFLSHTRSRFNSRRLHQPPSAAQQQDEAAAPKLKAKAGLTKLRNGGLRLGKPCIAIKVCEPPSAAQQQDEAACPWKIFNTYTFFNPSRTQTGFTSDALRI